MQVMGLNNRVLTLVVRDDGLLFTSEVVTVDTAVSIRVSMRIRLAVLAASALLLATPDRSVAQYAENFNSGIPAGWVGSGTFGIWNGAVYLDGTSSLYSPVFTMSGSGTIELFANFIAADELPWNDDASVQLWNGASWSQLFFANVASVGNYGTTGWTYLSTNVGPGTYQLAFAVNNRVDSYVDSHLLVDDISATLDPVVTPEPASLALMATGLLGVIGVAIRKHRLQR
jgi:hypothetical protein